MSDIKNKTVTTLKEAFFDDVFYSHKNSYLKNMTLEQFDEAIDSYTYGVNMFIDNYEEHFPSLSSKELSEMHAEYVKEYVYMKQLSFI